MLNMNARKAIGWLRDADKRLQRRLSNSRRVLVNARTEMNYAMMAPVIRAMREDSRVSFFYTSSEPDHNFPVQPPDGCVRTLTEEQAFPIRFDAYLAADMLWTPLLRGTCRIQMFHGVGGKYADVYDRPDHSMSAWDRLFFINQKRLDNFVSSGAIPPDSRSAILVGMPKVDCLVDGSLNREQVRTTLGLSGPSPTVLYAPTWSPYSSLNTIGEGLVKALCGAGYTVIVKLHDRSRDPEFVHSGGVDWSTRLEPILMSSGGVLATGSDSSPYLVAADLLITDHSSIGFEFLLLNRPVVRIDCPELISATRTNVEYVQLLTECSYTARNLTEILGAVETCLGAPQLLSSERQRVARELFYRPGTATSRAVQQIYEAIELDPPAIFASTATDTFDSSLNIPPGY